MNRISKLTIAPALVALILMSTLVVGAVAWWTPVAQAQESSSAATNRTITVVGVGSVRIQPDVARANFGVEVVKPTVKEALDENKALMDAVLAALQGQDIEEKDIQTSGFSIYAERYGPNGPLAEDEVNYRVSNNVTVIIRDLEQIGNILDVAVEAGANNIYGIEFRLEDTSKLEADARKSAIEAARVKAEDLASLTGVTIGDVVNVSEVITGGGIISNFAQPMRDGLGGGGATPIAPGELELNMQLQVTYAIQ